MKKTAGKIALFMVLIMLASAFSGCVLLDMAVGFAEMAVGVAAATFETGAAVAGAIGDAAATSAEKRRWQNMTPEEREQELEQERKKEWDRMSPSEQERFEKMEKYQGVDTF